VAIAVEGKVDETFGPTVGERRADASDGSTERLAYVLACLGLNGVPDSVRYQILHRAASAVLVADEYFAKHAVMLVHSFGPTDKWFADFAAFVADILHEVGVPYCKGGVMAKNPHWRGSVRTWQERIDHWIGRSSPADLLSIDIFFDLRGVHGAAGLATAIWRHGFDVAKGNAVFAKLLVDAAGAVQPGLTFFGRIRTENGRIDLKKAGLFGIVTTTRALAICHHVVERSTLERLAGIKERHIGGEHDLDGLAEAQGIFLDRIVAQQIEDLDQGVPPSNRVAVKSLARRDRDRLVAALQAVHHLEEVTRDLLF